MTSSKKHSQSNQTCEMQYTLEITDTETSWDLDDEDCSPSQKQTLVNKGTRGHRSVLIIGATGLISVEVLHQLSQNFDEIEQGKSLSVFGLTRDMKTVSRETNESFSRFAEGLIEGDPSDSLDLERALSLSNADTVIVAIGSDKLERSPTARALNAEALSQVLERDSFRHIRLVVLSSSEAARLDLQEVSDYSPKAKSIRRGLLRRSPRQGIAHDHAAQEDWFLSSPTVAQRTTILRSAPFVPMPKKSKRNLQKGEESSADSFSSSSTLKTTEFQRSTTRSSPKLSHRRDVAMWIAEEALRPKFTGRVRMGCSVEQ